MSKALEFGMVALFSAGAMAAVIPLVSKVANSDVFSPAKIAHALNATGAPPEDIATILNLWPVTPATSCTDVKKERQ